MSATKTFASGRPKGVKLLTPAQIEVIMDARDVNGAWRIRPEILAIQFGVTSQTIYNAVRKAKLEAQSQSATDSPVDSAASESKGRP